MGAWGETTGYTPQNGWFSRAFNDANYAHSYGEDYFRPSKYHTDGKRILEAIDDAATVTLPE